MGPICGLILMAGAQIGLSYGPGLVSFVERNPGMVDYVELPFELLRHDPSTAAVQSLAPLILHCASLSIARIKDLEMSVVSRRHCSRHLRNRHRRHCSRWFPPNG